MSDITPERYLALRTIAGDAITASKAQGGAANEDQRENLEYVRAQLEDCTAVIVAGDDPEGKRKEAIEKAVDALRQSVAARIESLPPESEASNG